MVSNGRGLNRPVLVRDGGCGMDAEPIGTPVPPWRIELVAALVEESCVIIIRVK